MYHLPVMHTCTKRIVNTEKNIPNLINYHMRDGIILSNTIINLQNIKCKKIKEKQKTKGHRLCFYDLFKDHDPKTDPTKDSKIACYNLLFFPLVLCKRHCIHQLHEQRQSWGTRDRLCQSSTRIAKAGAHQINEPIWVGHYSIIKLTKSSNIFGIFKFYTYNSESNQYLYFIMLGFRIWYCSWINNFNSNHRLYCYILINWIMSKFCPISDSEYTLYNRICLCIHEESNCWNKLVKYRKC